jgi:DNA-binding HxlR family transcriptional regulator
MYEKGSTFLRLEVLSNRLNDFGLGKSINNLDAVRQTLAAVTDRFTAFEASALNVHIDFPLFQRLALPIVAGRTKVPGIKIHDTRMVRLMEALLHSGTQIHGWRTAQLHQAILTAFGLTPSSYTLTQLRYDLRKLKAHGLIERDGSRYAYRLTEKGGKVALLFVLFHQRVCDPLANSLFNQPPNRQSPPATPLEMAYRKADTSIQHVLELLAA